MCADVEACAFSWVRNPWYKPQSSGFGYIRDRLAVFAGFYTEMPGPQYVMSLCFPELIGLLIILRSLKSSGYRLEELVSLGVS